MTMAKKLTNEMFENFKEVERLGQETSKKKKEYHEKLTESFASNSTRGKEIFINMSAILRSF